MRKEIKLMVGNYVKIDLNVAYQFLKNVRPNEIVYLSKDVAESRNLIDFFTVDPEREKFEKELECYASSITQSRFNNYHGFWVSVWQVVKGYRFRKKIKTKDALIYAEKIGVLPAEKMNIEKLLPRFNLKRGID